MAPVALPQVELTKKKKGGDMEMNNYFHTLADNIRNICGRVTITAVMVVSLGEEIYAALT